MKRLNCLAWDTSTQEAVVSFGVLNADQKQIEFKDEIHLSAHSSHSEGLLWGIHELLSRNHLDIAQIDLYITGVGPGSFTGLRIGMTTARTFAHLFNKPLIGVSSLSASCWLIAKSLKDQNSVIAYCKNAFGGEVYALMGSASCLSQAINQKLWSDQVVEASFQPEKFIEEFQKRAPKNRVIFGDAISIYPEINEAFGADLLEIKQTTQTLQALGKALLELGASAYLNGAYGLPLELTPQYLRGSSAEEKLKKGILKPSSVKSPL